MARRIRVLSPHGFPPHLAGGAATSLQQCYGASVEVRPFAFDFRMAHDRGRGQYLSAALLRQMLAAPVPDHDVKLVGLTEVDLYAPVLTFVFGEAQLDGSCAILSTFRLRNEFYGIPPDANTLAARIAKEAVHETGHLYGLIHCRSFDCVMRSSTYVEEIDLKSVSLCAECRRTLDSVEILNNETLSGMRSKKNAGS